MGMLCYAARSIRMSQKRTNQKTKTEEHGTRELLEGLRRDLFSLLLEAEGLLPFTAEKREIKLAPNSTATASCRLIRVNSRRYGGVLDRSSRSQSGGLP